MDKILAVDDSPLNLEILREMLGEFYTLRTADRGAEAIAIAADFRPDIILLDVMMPELDGLETCRRLRRVAGLERTSIIMLSAKAMPVERANGIDAGADDYITKPFEEEELLSLLHRCLLQKKAAAGNAEPSIKSNDAS